MKIICLDGFKPEYLSYMPNLRKISEESLHGELETVFSYTGISASFFSGSYPDKHGIFTMFDRSEKKIFIPKIGSKMLSVFTNLNRLMKNQRFFYKYYNIPGEARGYFKPALDRAWYQKDVLKLKTLFDYLRESNISFSYLDFPHLFDNKGGLFFKKSDREALVKMKKLKSEVQIVFLHELDSISHRYGPGSPEVIDHLRFLDEELSQIEGQTTYWSDHGFLKTKGQTDLLSGLKKLNLRYGKDYIYFLDSSMARFWFSNPEAKKKVEDFLRSVKNGKILTDSELKKLRVCKKQELIFLCDPGYVIFPNFFEKRFPAGMHGYNPKLKGQKGIYILKGVKGKKKDARLVDIMPTILKLLKIKQTSKTDGRSLV